MKRMRIITLILMLFSTASWSQDSDRWNWRIAPYLPASTAGPGWWDYFVGIKTHNSISAKWDFDFYGTHGTGGSDLPWTLQAMFGRRYANDAS